MGQTTRSSCSVLNGILWSLGLTLLWGAWSVSTSSLLRQPGVERESKELRALLDRATRETTVVRGLARVPMVSAKFNYRYVTRDANPGDAKALDLVYQIIGWQYAGMDGGQHRFIPLLSVSAPDALEPPSSALRVAAAEEIALRLELYLPSGAPVQPDQLRSRVLGAIIEPPLRLAQTAPAFPEEKAARKPASTRRKPARLVDYGKYTK